ncbi:MAG: S8 family serine peptidase [Alkalispirochaeta sp.]
MGIVTDRRSRRKPGAASRIAPPAVALLPLFLVILGGCEYGPFTSQSTEIPDAAAVTPNDPYFNDPADSQWYLDTIRAPGAWELYEANAGVTYGGTDVRQVVVSVIDSGIVAGHEDLSSVLTSDGIYLVGGVAIPIPTGLDPGDPSSTHGTHVAGLIGAHGGNGRGITGATYNGWPGPMIRLQPVAVLTADAEGGTTGFLVDVIAGVLYAAGVQSDRGTGADLSAGVINMSLGANTLLPGEILLFENAVFAASAADVFIVAAAGNKGTTMIDYPARFSEVVAVGSIDADLGRSDFSNYGVELDLVAPGATRSGNGNGDMSGIVSTFPPSGYASIAGTSMAAPLVAAAAAMVRSANPYLSAAEVRQILRDTARDLGPAGWDAGYGYGLVDMEAALRRALSEPYGRYSSSSTSSSSTASTITPAVVSPERRLEYDAAKADAEWDATGRKRLSVLIAADGDPDRISALPGVLSSRRAPMPEGTLIRFSVDPARGAELFDTLRQEPTVLLVTQERPIQFSQQIDLQSSRE